MSPFSCALLAATAFFSGGRTDWTVHVAPDADATVVYAADELTNALYRVSGAAFPVKRTDGGVAELAIAFKAGNDRLAKEVSRVVTTDGGLLFEGNSPRAALYAVYDFLEKEFGCRWFWSGEEGAYYPRKSSFVLPSIDRTRVPCFRFRGMFNPDARDLHEIWQSRNRLNAWAGKPATTRLTGSMNVNGNHIVGLTCEDVKKHPQMLALVNGERCGAAGCWSNPQFPALMAERIAAWCEKMNLSVVQPFVADVCDRCGCDACKKEAGDDPKGYWWKTFAKIRKEVLKIRPGQKFAALAYQEYRNKPKTLPGADELEFVEYAQYNRCYVHAAGDPACPLNAKSFGEIGEWAKIAKMGVYGYEFDVFRPHMYVPFWNMLADEMKTFRKIGFVDVKTETCNWSTGAKDSRAGRPQEIHRLAAWIYTRLLFDPDADIPSLIRDFSSYVYGAGGEAMTRYHLAMARAWDAMKEHIHYFGRQPASFAAKFLSAALVKTAENAFAEAKKAVFASSAPEEAKKRQFENIALDEIWFGQWADIYRVVREDVVNIAVPDAGSFDGATAFPFSRGGGKETTLRVYAADRSLEVRVECAAKESVDAENDVIELCIADTTGICRRFSAKAGKKRSVGFSVPYALFGAKPSPGESWKLLASRKSLTDMSVFPENSTGDISSGAVLYFCGKAPKGRSVLWINDQGAYPPMIDPFLKNGWSPVFATYEAARKKDLSRYSMVFLEMYSRFRNTLPDGFYKESLLPALTNGAVVVVYTYGSPAIDRWFADPGLRVGSELYKLDPWRKTSSVTDSDFIRYPSDIGELLMKRHYPSSGAFRLDGEKWEALASRKDDKGEELAYLACRPYGKGLLVLWMSGGGKDIEIYNNLHEYNKRVVRPAEKGGAK